jgi:hypothetical protein
MRSPRRGLEQLDPMLTKLPLAAAAPKSGRGRPKGTKKKPKSE